MEGGWSWREIEKEITVRVEVLNDIRTERYRQGNVYKVRGYSL